MEFLTPTVGAYVVLLILLGVYGLHRVSMLLRFRWGDQAPASTTAGVQQGDRLEAADSAMSEEFLPTVTVQLPLYNERTVAARLIETVGDLDYPADRLEIQVLDDSTDETREIVDAAVEALVARGLKATVIRRSDRSGYKAGALDYGMGATGSDFLCVFDADFIPSSDFLRALVPHFEDPGVGMVQARWEHVNREDSLLTRAQSTLLDGHFVIEHKVRFDGGLFFNFNGTAGIWRRTTIEDAGGWQHDTLTEDLDLSYRAQLAGWRFIYAPMVAAPAEVPPTLLSFKSQQHRWAKGSVQVARKLGWRILSSKAPLRNKLEAVAHLTGNTGYPLVLLLAILLPLVIVEQERLPGLWHMGMFLLCTASVVAFYDRSQKALGRSAKQRLRDVPAAIALGIGMCVSQTRAVVEGLFQKTGEFVRTPKRGDAPTPSTGYRAALVGLPGIELLFAAWFLWGLFVAGSRGLWGSMPFLLLFLFGFGWVGTLSLSEWLRARRR